MFVGVTVYWLFEWHRLTFSFILYITSDFSLFDYLCSPVHFMRSLILYRWPIWLISFTSFYHLLPFLFLVRTGMALVVSCGRLTAVYHLLSHVYLLVSPRVRFSDDVA
jgi:hypothetical protein